MWQIVVFFCIMAVGCFCLLFCVQCVIIVCEQAQTWYGNFETLFKGVMLYFDQ